MCDNCCAPFIEGEGCSSALQKRASNVASGDYSAATGHGTIAANEGELSAGTYNRSNSGQLFSVGIGTSDSNRMNAIQVNRDGSTSFLYNGQLVKLTDLIQNVSPSSQIILDIQNGYIVVSYNGGESYTNLIPLSELKGEDGQPGQDGAPGTPGQDGASLVNVTAQIGTNDGGNPSVVATYNNGTLNLTFNNIVGGGGGGSYTLPAATSNALGGIKIGYDESGNNNNYAVKLDDNNKAYVTVVNSGSDTPGPIGPAGADGVSVSDMMYLFKAGDSPTVMDLPSSSTYPTIASLANIGWLTNSSSIILDTNNPYLWCFLRIAYSNGTVSHVGPWCVRYLNQDINIDYQEIADRVIGQIDSDLANIKSRLNAIDGPNSQFVQQNGLTQILNSYIRYDAAGNGVTTFRGFADAVYNAEEASIKQAAGAEFADELAGANLTLNGIAASLSAAVTQQDLTGAINDARTEWRGADDNVKAAITSTVTKAQYIWYDTATGDIYEYDHFTKTSGESFADYELRVKNLFGKDQNDEYIIELRLIADEMSAIKQESDNILLVVGDGTNYSAGLQILKNAQWRDPNGNLITNPNGTPATGSKIILDAGRVEINGVLSAGIISANAAAIKQLAAEQINATTIVADTLTTRGVNNSYIEIDDGFINFYDNLGNLRISMGQGSNDTSPVLNFYSASDDVNPLYNLGPDGIFRSNGPITLPEWTKYKAVMKSQSGGSFDKDGTEVIDPASAVGFYRYDAGYRALESPSGSGIYVIQYMNPFDNTFSGTEPSINGDYFNQYRSHLDSSTYTTYLMPLGEYIVMPISEDRTSGRITAPAVRINTVNGERHVNTNLEATFTQSGDDYILQTIAPPLQV